MVGTMAGETKREGQRKARIKRERARKPFSPSSTSDGGVFRHKYQPYFN
jgi:hypothetical protein